MSVHLCLPVGNKHYNPEQPTYISSIPSEILRNHIFCSLPLHSLSVLPLVSRSWKSNYNVQFFKLVLEKYFPSFKTEERMDRQIKQQFEHLLTLNARFFLPCEGDEIKAEESTIKSIRMFADHLYVLSSSFDSQTVAFNSLEFPHILDIRVLKAPECFVMDISDNKIYWGSKKGDLVSGDLVAKTNNMRKTKYRIQKTIYYLRVYKNTFYFVHKTDSQVSCLRENKKLCSLGQEMDNPITCLEIELDHLFVGHLNGLIESFYLKEAEPKCGKIASFKGAILNLQVSGNKLFAKLMDGKVGIWNFKTDERSILLDPDLYITSFSVYESWLAIAGILKGDHTYQVKWLNIIDNQQFILFTTTRRIENVLFRRGNLVVTFYDSEHHCCLNYGQYKNP